MKETLCVVIPVHKPVLTLEEEISLKACRKHLRQYDCYLVYPEGMKTIAYRAIFEDLHFMPVNPLWLSSVEQYNKMKLRLPFYEMFKSFEFMLTYELDSYIFHADFHNANVFSFDFIGAPFFQGYLSASPDSPFIQGCNSGFSVRRISSCMRVIQSMNKYRAHWNFYKYVFSNVPRLSFHLNRLTGGRLDIFINGKLGFHFADTHINEDQVWSQIVPKLFPFFRVADPMNALKFSFEHNPERLFESNEERLPLGCHAWSKYPYFWEKYIMQ